MEASNEKAPVTSLVKEPVKESKVLIERVKEMEIRWSIDGLILGLG